MVDVKVKGHDNLVRRGPALVNTDRDGFQAYIASREAALAKESEFNSLKDEVSELKDLVRQLLGEKNAKK